MNEIYLNVRFGSVEEMWLQWIKVTCCITRVICELITILNLLVNTLSLANNCQTVKYVFNSYVINNSVKYTVQSVN